MAKYLDLINDSGAIYICTEFCGTARKNHVAYWVEFQGDVYRWTSSSLRRNSKPWEDDLSKYPGTKGPCLYRFFGEGELLYIGKSVKFTERLHAHFVKYREDWKDLVTTVDVSVLKNEADMHILEMYLIAKYKPKYNKEAMCEALPSFELPEPTFTEITGWD